MFKNQLKSLIKSKEDGEGNDKKKIENLVFFVIILIITIVIINIIWNGNNKKKVESNNDTSKKLASSAINTTPSESIQATDNLEEKLENILSKIQGVGDVKVCINYNESNEVVAMYNENSKVSTTEETDTSGGIRKIQENNSQKDIIFKEDSGEKTPITQKVVQAKIEGAIITAKGAGNVSTKTNIIQAVEAVTGLATHKIQVFEMN